MLYQDDITNQPGGLASAEDEVLLADIAAVHLAELAKLVPEAGAGNYLADIRVSEKAEAAKIPLERQTVLSVEADASLRAPSDEHEQAGLPDHSAPPVVVGAEAARKESAVSYPLGLLGQIAAFLLGAAGSVLLYWLLF